MTSIIILSYNTHEYTKLCIESIRRHTPKGTYEIIVVDNASKDESVPWLKAQPDVKLLCNEENVGFPKGCNQGISIAAGDELLFLNSDTIVTPRWLDNLRTALHSAADIGAVSCVTNQCSNGQQIDVAYKDLRELVQFADRYNRSNPANWFPWLTLVAFCLLVKREVYDRIGGWDERFSPGNFEDDDYSFRMWQAGYRLLLCGDTFIHHWGSVSFVKGESQEEKEKRIRAYNAMLEEHEELFRSKWHMPKHYKDLSPEDVFPFLRPPGQPEPKRPFNRLLDGRKICFIAAVNDAEQYNASLASIRRLHIPEGMKLESIYVADAASMASAYQEAMMSSDAKYKIYLHQDAWITHREFLDELIRLFREHPDYGIMGVAGSTAMPETGIWHRCECRSQMAGAIEDSHTGAMETYVWQEYAPHCIEARALDGVLLATQYDIPWRDDIFDQWHFCDASQCMEFYRRRYKAAILPQKTPWVRHYCKPNPMAGFEASQSKFVQEYAEELKKIRESGCRNEKQ